MNSISQTVAMLEQYQSGDMPLSIRMSGDLRVADSFTTLAGLVSRTYGSITDANRSEVTKFVGKLQLGF